MELKSPNHTLKVIFYLCILQVLFLIPAFQIGEFYLNSDFSVYYLFADRIGTQYSSPFFYYESTYGGTIIAHVRALFTSIISIFTSSNEFPQFRANQIFTFLIFPLFFTASTFYTCTAFFSRSASLFVGLITAIGLQYWIHRIDRKSVV